MRLFIEQTVEADQIIELNKEASHYLQHVLRLKTGQQLKIFNGEKPLGEYAAEIIAMNRHCITLKVLHFIEKNNESGLSINLFQGISKAERMDFTIQKSVELGVTSIYPVWMSRTNVKFSDQKRQDKKIQHWRNVCYHAMEQSDRTANVVLHEPVDFTDIFSRPAELSLCLHPVAANTLDQISSQSQPCSINLLIGPEGGLTEYEYQLAEDNHYQALQLGPRILRTETASLAIISICQALWGDFK